MTADIYSIIGNHEFLTLTDFEKVSLFLFINPIDRRCHEVSMPEQFLGGKDPKCPEFESRQSSGHQIISTLWLIAFRCTSSNILKGVRHKMQFRQVCGYCNAEKIWKLSFFEHSIKIIWCPERDLMTADIYSIIGDREFLTSNNFEPAPKKTIIFEKFTNKYETNFSEHVFVSNSL